MLEQAHYDEGVVGREEPRGGGWPGDIVRRRDIVGLRELELSIRKRLSGQPGGGILLYGPPGCGKRTIIRGVAAACGARFLRLDVRDLLHRPAGEYGESLPVRGWSPHGPSVVFLDGIGASLEVTDGDAEPDEGRLRGALERLFRRGVVLVAAAAWTWRLDPWLLGHGRLEQQVFVPAPDERVRREVLSARLTGLAIARDDLERLVRATVCFSWSDLELLAASVRRFAGDRPISGDELLATARRIQPSTRGWLGVMAGMVRQTDDGSLREVEAYLRSVASA